MYLLYLPRPFFDEVERVLLRELGGDGGIENPTYEQTRLVYLALFVPLGCWAAPPSSNVPLPGVFTVAPPRTFRARAIKVVWQMERYNVPFPFLNP